MDDRIWDLFVELRKELVESQRIRALVVGFKITFVSTAVGTILTKIGDRDAILFVVPAFAAVLFDFLIYSYSFSIKRIGSYVRDYIEPGLSKQGHMPEDFVQWQDYLTRPKNRQDLAHYGNFGFTALIVLIGGVSLFFPFRPWLSLPLLATLIIFSIFDLAAYRSPRRLGKFLKEEDPAMCNQERWKFINSFAPWLSALGTTGGVLTALYLAGISGRARSDAFEPRIVVSAFAPFKSKEVNDPDTGVRKYMIESGRLSLKNVGKGEALNLACHIVNPFSRTPGHQYAYHRFRSEPWALLLCSGESIEEGFKRQRPYNRVLAAGEEQEFCVQELDSDPTIFGSFLVVRCSYLDKEGTPKGGDEQEVDLPSGFIYSNEEMDVPAKKIWERYQDDPRVRQFLKHAADSKPARTSGLRTDGE